MSQIQFINLAKEKFNNMKVLFLLLALIFLFCGKEKEAPASIPNETKTSTTSDDVKEEQTTPKSLTLGPHLVNAPSGLMLRSEPSKTGTVIVKMLNGMKAEVLEYSPNEDVYEGNRAKWAKVKYKKYTGWAFSYYLKPDKGAKTISK